MLHAKKGDNESLMLDHWRTIYLSLSILLHPLGLNNGIDRLARQLQVMSLVKVVALVFVLEQKPASPAKPGLGWGSSFELMKREPTMPSPLQRQTK